MGNSFRKTCMGIVKDVEFGAHDGSCMCESCLSKGSKEPPSVNLRTPAKAADIAVLFGVLL